MNLVKEITAWIAEERKRQQRSIGELARKSGISKSTLWRWEQGAAPSLSYVEDVIKALGFQVKLVFVEESK